MASAQFTPYQQSVLDKAREVLREKTNTDAAERSLRDAIRIWERAGATDPDFASALARVVVILLQPYSDDPRLEFYEVVPLARKALALREGDPNTSPADLAFALELYSEALRSAGQRDEAEPFWDRARQIRQKIIDEMIPSNVAEAPPPSALAGHCHSSPLILSKVEPIYPEEARQAKRDGKVVALLSVGADGVPYHFLILRNGGFGFDEQAVKALRQWRFHPAVEGGRPVNARTTVELNFRQL